MLSFLLLVSTSGQPLPGDAVARLAPLPRRALAFTPAAMTTWRADGDHVALVAWSDGVPAWHVGAHGVTLASGQPWPLASRFTAPGGVAFELTSRLGDGDDPGQLSWLTGDAAVVRVRPDGSGLVGAPPLGGGAVHVAEGDGLLAVSDRAGVAALGIGGGVRRTALPDLLTGTLLGDHAALLGVDRLRPGSHLRLRGRDGAKVVVGATPWQGLADATVGDLVADATDDLTRLLGLAAEHGGSGRVVELGADRASLVVAAALAATGRAEAFTLRPSGPGRDAAAAARLAAVLDRPLADPVVAPRGGEATDERVRVAVARVEGAVAPSVLRPGALAGVRDEDGLVVPAMRRSVLDPQPRTDAGRLLTSGAAEELATLDRAWEAAQSRDVVPAQHAVLGWLERRGPRLSRAMADLAGPAATLDPLATPSVARLALVAARDGHDATGLLVAALHAPLADVPPDATTPDDDAGWRALAPVLDAHLLGHAREVLADVVDLDRVAGLVRSAAPPDLATREALEGALALAVWAAGTDRHAPVPARAPVARVHVAPAQDAPVLVTGVTSRSLLDLTGVRVPMDETTVDALLGVRVDVEARDLAHRLLLAAGATPGHLPADLDERLAGTRTAGLVDAATSLLARRGGTLVDPRLALTLPFFTSHLGAARVVLVAERPPDLAARSSAQLPGRDLLGWWVDAVAAAAAAEGADVRVVDPGDLADLDEDEATGWEGLEGEGAPADLVRVARTVDSLVREVELEAARPLLRTVRRSRAEAVAGRDEPDAPAAAPLRVVDELWERAVQADSDLGEQRAAAADLRARLERTETELDDLRGRRGLRAAWQLLTGKGD